MASTNKTANYLLNQWLGNDSMKKEDWNSDNLIIDTKFKSVFDTLALHAPLASPAFTGVPTAPTAPTHTNTTQIATTAYYISMCATATPLMNGTAAIGSSDRYARQDHVHPTDTTRASGVDSGWLVLTPGSNFKIRDSNTTFDVRYRKIGNAVRITGQLSPVAATLAAGTYTLGTLPAGYRPSYEINYTMGIPGTSIVCIGWIGTDGVISFTNPSALATTNLIQMSNIPEFYID